VGSLNHGGSGSHNKPIACSASGACAPGPDEEEAGACAPGPDEEEKEEDYPIVLQLGGGRTLINISLSYCKNGKCFRLNF
jgi:hypothetical protein